MGLSTAVRHRHARVPAGPGFPQRSGARVPQGRAFPASASAASGPRPDSESGRGACRGGRKFCPFRAMIPAGFFACFRWKVLLVSEGKFCRFRTMIPAANGNFARFARQTAAGGQGLGWTRSGGPALDNGAGRRACRVAGGPGAAGEPRSGASLPSLSDRPRPSQQTDPVHDPVQDWVKRLGAGLGLPSLGSVPCKSTNGPGPRPGPGLRLPSLEPAPSESTNGPGPRPGPGLCQKTRSKTESTDSVQDSNCRASDQSRASRQTDPVQDAVRDWVKRLGPKD